MVVDGLYFWNALWSPTLSMNWVVWVEIADFYEKLLTLFKNNQIHRIMLKIIDYLQIMIGYRMDYKYLNMSAFEPLIEDMVDMLICCTVLFKVKHMSQNTL